MTTPSNTTTTTLHGGLGTPAATKQLYVAQEKEKVSDKTVGVCLDKAAKKSDETAADVSESGGGEGGMKAVWNKMSDGAVEAVMGADSWPALSDTGKSLLKSFMESATEVVVPSLQGTTPARSSRKQVPTNPPQPNSIQSNALPARQKSFMRHGGSISSNINSPTQPLPSFPSFSQSQSSSVPSNQNTTNAHKNLEPGPKITVVPQPHGTVEPPQHKISQKKGIGLHQHGDGSYNHRYGNRKDHDRPNRNCNNQGNGRDTYPQPTKGSPRGIIKHLHMPHTSGMYVAPPMRPFGSPISYPDFPFYYVLVPPESIRGFGIPYPSTGPNQMLMQFIDPELHSGVLNQIDYYFSNENLVKDIYLRKNMDEEGWVSLELIAGFKQVKKLTHNIAFIMEVLKTSTVVEVKDDKVRRRNDWRKWLVPGSLKIPSPSTVRDRGSSSPLAARIQKLNIGQENTDIPSSSSPSCDPSSQHQGH